VLMYPALVRCTRRGGPVRAGLRGSAAVRAQAVAIVRWLSQALSPS